jgi:homoserine kinase
VSFDDAVANVQRASLLVAAVAAGRVDVLAEATRDRLHQPYRSALLPGLETFLLAAVAAGARGAFLSGAGPSVLALWPAEQPVPPELTRAMTAYLGENGGGRVRRLALAVHGATVAASPSPDERLSP